MFQAEMVRKSFRGSRKNRLKETAFSIHNYGDLLEVLRGIIEQGYGRKHSANILESWKRVQYPEGEI